MLLVMHSNGSLSCYPHIRFAYSAYGKTLQLLYTRILGGIFDAQKYVSKNALLRIATRPKDRATVVETASRSQPKVCSSDEPSSKLL